MSESKFRVDFSELTHYNIAYEWYIKLSYNYGMFITVKWVEGLLHKNFIVAPEWVEWKKYYNIWDKIKVKAKEFKIINDEKKVVWSQK